MSYYNEMEKERLENCNKMREVRGYKENKEDLSNKKNRFSKDESLVNNTKKKVKKINYAVETILTSIGELNSHKYAWSFGCDDLDQFYKDNINLPTSVINNLKQLSKLQKSLEDHLGINDLIILDFFRLLNCVDLADTTLRIMKKEGLTVNINTIIETIKRIHVEHLLNFNIPKKVLDRFKNNKNVKATRPNTEFSYRYSDDIHIKFEVELNSSFGNKTSRKENSLFRLGSSQDKKKSKSKRKYYKRNRFDLE